VLVVDLGVAAYRRLLGRRIETAFALPVIVGTGHRSVIPAVEAPHVGAVAFLPKPVHARELVLSVRAALEKAQALRSLSRAQR
jgi:FixJ family two-component response regulator